MKRLVLFLTACMVIFSCAGQRPETIGVHNSRLAECPARPNCVSSQTIDKDHAIASFSYQGGKAAALMRLKKIMLSFERTTMVTENDHYLHFECKSTVMGFVDDVEFYFPEEKIIHLRSASRLGYSDFGVNRKRLEKLRKLFDGNSIHKLKGNI